MKMIRYFLAAFIFSTISVKNVSAQIEIEKPTGKDDKKVKVFSNEDYFDDGRGGLEKNAIKFDPALLFFGEVSLFYERRITDFASIEIGGGPTISSPVTVLATDFFGIFDGTLEKYEEYWESNIGLTYKVAGRFFPANDGDPEGAYIGPAFQYKDFRFIAPVGQLNGTPGQEFDLKWKYTDLMAQVGYQYEAIDYIYLDLYGAVGIRRKSVEYIDETYNETTFEYSYKMETLKKNGIGYVFGTKIGVVF